MDAVVLLQVKDGIHTEALLGFLHRRDYVAN